MIEKVAHNMNVREDNKEESHEDGGSLADSELDEENFSDPEVECV